MGATVSMELAAARPDLVQGLVLIDPVIVPPRHVPMLARPASSGCPGASFRSLKPRHAAHGVPLREAAVENYVGKGPFRTWPREWIEAYVDGGTIDTEEGRPPQL